MGLAMQPAFDSQPLMHYSFDDPPHCSSGRIGRCRGAQTVAAGPGGGVLDKPTTKGLPGIDLGYDAANALQFVHSAIDIYPTALNIQLPDVGTAQRSNGQDTTA